MATHNSSESAPERQDIEVIYPDGTRGTMTPEAWRSRDPALDIRRLDADDALGMAEAVNDVTPTNEPDE